jgi:hypothetical protein
MGWAPPSGLGVVEGKSASLATEWALLDHE